MAHSSDDITKFFDLFQGNERAHGVTEVGEIVDGKAEAHSRLVYEELTPAIIQRHIEGSQSIGIAPITDEGTCKWCAIDIDDYKYDLMDVVRAIYDFHMPLCPCYSKSKKLHIYIFFEDFIDADEAIKIARRYADAFACDKKTEIFPKQRKASEERKFYSWINLPYFNEGDRNNHRKMIDRDGELISLGEALPIMNANAWPLARHKAFIEDMPYSDAPPCIFSGILLRDIGKGSRNNWLFSVGVYLRLKDEHEDIKGKLLKINASLKDPLPENELENTVLKGLSNKSYFYMCASMERCDKARCRALEFGVESKQSTGMEFGEFRQIMTDPPYYTWIVNGQRMVFDSESDVLSQSKFQTLCLRQLHKVPRKVPEDRWAHIVTRACENIIVEYPVEGSEDFTIGSTFLQITYAFFNSRRLADTIEQTAMGRVYFKEDTKEFVFSPYHFITYLKQKNNFNAFKDTEVRTRLLALGMHPEGTLWAIPSAAIPKQKEVKSIFRPHEVEEEVGF